VKSTDRQGYAPNTGKVLTWINVIPSPGSYTQRRLQPLPRPDLIESEAVRDVNARMTPADEEAGHQGA
jgi:hypothetical protein